MRLEEYSDLMFIYHAESELNNWEEKEKVLNKLITKHLRLLPSCLRVSFHCESVAIKMIYRRQFRFVRSLSVSIAFHCGAKIFF